VQTEAFHHRSDAITSLAAGVGITIAVIGGPAWAVADDWAALFSCGIIISNGLHMLRGAMGEILDEQIPSEQVREIIEQAAAVEGVSNIEKCRVRKSGLVRIADLHVRVPGDCTVREGHRIAHEVQNKLLEADFHLADVTVHIEPDN
jgi:cation diffusion facilitator family transporter